MGMITNTKNWAELEVSLRKELMSAKLLGQEVYYFDPNNGDALDVVKLKDGVLISMFGDCSIKKTIEQHPNGAFCNSDMLMNIRTQMYRLPVSEITEERFTKALNCMPPVQWVLDADGTESFKLAERYVDDIRDIYVKVDDRYFSMRDETKTTHAQCVELARSYAAEHPVEDHESQRMKM